MIRHSITKSVTAAQIGLALLSGQAAAQNAFDFSPEQKDRPRTQSNPEAVKAIPADFKFVREGYLTVAIAPFAPPISTYATDAKTVVGADPDYARLVAESLGLQLDLQPIAWADWPLGLTSGKYDAVISNVGVTEARKEKFDFSTYRLGLHGFYVKKDSRIQKIAEPKDVAGLRIITGSGTNQERIISSGIVAIARRGCPRSHCNITTTRPRSGLRSPRVARTSILTRTARKPMRRRRRAQSGRSEPSTPAGR